MRTLILLGVALSVSAAAAPISVYGAWVCSNDGCSWSTVRNMTDFDQKNHWLIDRGDGRPSVNLVVLSFVNPLKLLNTGAAPAGMTSEVVKYFADKGIRVMLSIGGITYTKDWNTALATNPVKLAQNAAALAARLGVGIEIDYEENRSPNLVALQQFIDTYRSIHPYDSVGANPAARLTIDLAAGDRWLIGITRKATADWLQPNGLVLDYANAMVPARQPNSAADAQANWQEHIDGKPQYAPPIPPLAPARFTGSLYLEDGRKVAVECTKFLGSLEDTTGNYVQTVLPKAGATAGMLGYMFWAAECPSSTCATNCAGGVGVGASQYLIPIPMQPLRPQ